MRNKLFIFWSILQLLIIKSTEAQGNNANAKHGSVVVTIYANGAKGATWTLDGGQCGWLQSGATLNNVSVGTHTIKFNTVPGYTCPQSQTIMVTANNTYRTSGTCNQALGSVNVSITTNGANGAMWVLDNGTLWQQSGATINNVSIGNHTVKFNSVSGYTSPQNQTVTVMANNIARVLNSYTRINNNVINNTVSAAFVSPVSNERLVGGNKYTIAANLTGKINELILKYSTDGGINWNTISTLYPSGNSISYNWTIPSITSSNCKVGIVVNGSGSPSAISNNFSISANTGLSPSTSNATHPSISNSSNSPCGTFINDYVTKFGDKFGALTCVNCCTVNTCCMGNKTFIIDPWRFWLYTCTSYVAWKINETAGYTDTNKNGSDPFNNTSVFKHKFPNGLGNAYLWAGALCEFYRIDGIPSPHAIAFYKSRIEGSDKSGLGFYGHVAFVECVNGNEVVLSEYNCSNICGFDTKTIDITNPHVSGHWAPDAYIHIFEPEQPSCGN